MRPPAPAPDPAEEIWGGQPGPGWELEGLTVSDLQCATGITDEDTPADGHGMRRLVWS